VGSLNLIPVCGSDLLLIDLTCKSLESLILVSEEQLNLPALDHHILTDIEEGIISIVWVVLQVHLHGLTVSATHKELKHAINWSSVPDFDVLKNLLDNILVNSIVHLED